MEEENKKEKEGASFSMQVKEELSYVEGTSRHCKLAELAALVLCCGRLVDRKKDDGYKDSCISKTLLFESENETVLRKYFTFVQKTFNIETDVSNSRIDRFRKGNLYCISIIDQFLVKEILDSAKLEFSGVSGGMPLVSNSIVYQRDCCKRAFVRGAFLSAGSISDPQKGYHFEIVCPSREISGQLQEIIHSFHIDAKIVLRKKSYVLYVKEGAQIVDMLAIMEANVALMDLENIRILKEMRNSVNRKVNCETANINKTVNAAVNPQVGKSGVNHRLRKLSLLADDLRENKEELL